MCSSGAWGVGRLGGNAEVDGAAGHDGGNGVFVHHLRDSVAQQNYVLVVGVNLALQFDTVDQVDGDRHVFSAQLVQKWVLQREAFVVIHGFFLSWWLWVFIKFYYRTLEVASEFISEILI